MIHKTNLRLTRRQTDLLQQDVAYLLDVDSTYLNKIEKGSRPPTVDVILIYHILFEASIDELLTEQYVAIAKKIITRSLKLIEQLKAEPSSKSIHRITYLEKIVNSIYSKVYD